MLIWSTSLNIEVLDKIEVEVMNDGEPGDIYATLHIGDVEYKQVLHIHTPDGLQRTIDCLNCLNKQVKIALLYLRSKEVTGRDASEH